MLQMERATRYRAPKIIEGGAIHVDGEGTVLVTEACLLAEDRNTGITKPEIEQVLKDYLGVSQVVWLGAGVPHDETGGHVDNLACFVRPGEVLLSWCDDPGDPHYDVSRDAQARLLAAHDAKGRHFTVRHIPMPKAMFFQADEAAGIDQTAYGMNRRAGERLAASYINFYIANGAIIASEFGVETDVEAKKILAALFPDRDIITLPGREILLGGGNIHCITQQQPARLTGRTRPAAL